MFDKLVWTGLEKNQIEDDPEGSRVERSDTLKGQATQTPTTQKVQNQ